MKTYLSTLRLSLRTMMAILLLATTGSLFAQNSYDLIPFPSLDGRTNVSPTNNVLPASHDPRLNDFWQPANFQNNRGSLSPPSMRQPDDWLNSDTRFLNGRDPSRSRMPVNNRPRDFDFPTAPSNGTPTQPSFPSYEEWLRNEYGRDAAPVNNNPYQPLPYQPLPSPVPTVPTTPALDPAIEELQKMQQSVSFRYRNPVLMRFLQSLTSQQAVTLYREINDLVDRRGLEPTSYRQRVEKSVANLNAALQNSDFQQVNQLRLTTQQISSFQAQLAQAVSASAIQTRDQATQAMQRAMTLGQQVGLRPQVVAIEFIFGTTDTLDKYSAFVPDDVRTAPSAAAVEDSVVGIGIEVKKVEEGLRVERVLNNGPAHEAGLLAGDVIVNVDGKTLSNLTLDASVDLIGGPSGSRITLGIKRNNGAPFAVSMIRRRVEIQSVSDVRMLDTTQGVGYIRLDKFAEKSAAEMEAALWNLHQKGMKSLVLDVRGNPGGLLTTAIEISNKFLPRGTIVSTKGRLAEDNSSSTATLTQTWKTPLVVLVDENSASASEIFAAAIQENGRGVIVGRKTYGKGSVQTHFPLSSVSGALRLTTAKFYSPNGRTMAGAGVTPDVTVDGFTLESRSMQSGDMDIAAALRIAPRPELAEMAQKSAQPGNNSVPGFSLSNLR